MFFHWSLNNRKSPQVSRTLVSILAYLSNGVFWIVSMHPPISNSSSFLTKRLGIVPWVPITIGITVTFMFNSFFVLWQGVSTCVSFYLLWLFLCGLLGRQIIIQQVLIFLIISSRCGLLDEIRRSVCIWKSQRILWVSFFRKDSDLCIHHLVVWSNFIILHNSPPCRD